jgi:large repetitive protein
MASRTPCLVLVACGGLSLAAWADDSATNFAPAVLAAGPAAYWRLNETAGTNAKDLVRGHDGTLHSVALGAPAPAPPTFVGLTTNNLPNGSSGYVQTTLSISGNQGTFMALVNPNGGQVSGAAICIGRGSGANVCAMDMQGDGVDLQYVWANDPGTWDFNPGFAPPPNQWSFAAASISHSQAVMYVDSGRGLMAATNLHTHGLVGAAGPITIGGDPIFGSRYFNGMIAEVAVSNRALTPAEIAGIDRYACISNLTQTPVAFEPVGGEFVFKRPSVAGISRGSSFASSNDRDRRF